MWSIIKICTILISLCAAENKKVEYFEKADLECDDITLNLTQTAPKNITRYWILPSGKVIDKHSIPPKVKNEDQWTLNMTTFELVMNRVDDTDFGHYRCVIVYSNSTIVVVSQGVNVDGPYFGRLEKEYRHNAIVGGIAAGSLLVVIGGACLVWQLRFSKRNNGKNDKNSIEDNEFDDIKKGKINNGANFDETEKL